MDMNSYYDSGKILLICRGLPGSGKTTFSKFICNNLLSRGFGETVFIEADQYFYDEDGNYNFDPKKLRDAHEDCFSRVKNSMATDHKVIALSNTGTKESEVQPYIDLANDYNYNVVSIIVENRHGNKSVHDVPEKTVEAMRNRFSVSL